MHPLRFRLIIFLAVFMAVMGIGTFGFVIVEKMSLFDSLYFSIVTVATVGYGDIHPVTHSGKLLTIFLIVMGVGTFLGVVANATEIMLSKRETQARLQKLNMVIGVFFSEVGTRLIAVFSDFDPHLDQMKRDLIITDHWREQDFQNICRRLGQYEYGVDIHKVDLEEMRTFLLGKRDFLVRLLENPVLLEHETFTELLRAIFHLAEELGFRDDMDRLPDSDKAHLGGDMKRAYALLVDQWLDYMRHLRDHYPYLFSLAIRMNPFDQKASPIVR